MAVDLILTFVPAAVAVASDQPVVTAVPPRPANFVAVIVAVPLVADATVVVAEIAASVPVPVAVKVAVVAAAKSTFTNATPLMKLAFVKRAVVEAVGATDANTPPVAVAAAIFPAAANQFRPDLARDYFGVAFRIGLYRRGDPWRSGRPAQGPIRSR